MTMKMLCIGLIPAVMLVYMTACTWAPQERESSGHTSAIPSVQFCVLAACDGQWNDRAQEAGTEAIAEEGDTTATQEASSTPTLEIPVEAF